MPSSAWLAEMTLYGAVVGWVVVIEGAEAFDNLVIGIGVVGQNFNGGLKD